MDLNKVRDELAEMHDNACYRIEPYKELSHAESYKQGFDSAVAAMKSRESELLARVRELEAVIQKRVDIETKSIEKYGAYFSDPMMNQYEIERKALKKEGI